MGPSVALFLPVWYRVGLLWNEGLDGVLACCHRERKGKGSIVFLDLTDCGEGVLTLWEKFWYTRLPSEQSRGPKRDRRPKSSLALRFHLGYHLLSPTVPTGWV